MTHAVADARRLVIKVGSSLVTNEGRGVDRAAIKRWAGQVAALRARGKQILLVSSGAIAEGMQRLGWTRRPHALRELQAAAAVGQEQAWLQALCQWHLPVMVAALFVFLQVVMDCLVLNQRAVASPMALIMAKYGAELFAQELFRAVCAMPLHILI